MNLISSLDVSIYSSPFLSYISLLGKSSDQPSGFGKGEAFGSDASGQSVKYFAECFAPTTNPQTYF
jgi:hypothetical protein